MTHYEECIRNGCSPLLAEMLASGTPPQASTEREFLQGRENGRQFQNTPWVGDLYKQQAKAAGVDITGKVYEPQLAEYPGDPRAWFSDRSEIKRRCEEIGAGCGGIVPVKPRQREPQKPVDVADDIVDSVTQTAIANDPGLLDMPLPELKDKIKNKIKPRRK